MSGVDLGAQAWRATVNFFGVDVNYEEYGVPGGAKPVRMFIRGIMGVEDTFGAALQSDKFGVVDWAVFAVAFPGRPRPLKFDKVRTLGPLAMAYTVEEWRASPDYGAEPVVLKLLLRGGNQ
jgi:hypothetical protein